MSITLFEIIKFYHRKKKQLSQIFILIIIKYEFKIIIKLHYIYVFTQFKL